MTDLGPNPRYLDIDVKYDMSQKILETSQENHIISKPKKFGVTESKNYKTSMDQSLKTSARDQINNDLKYRNLIWTFLLIANEQEQVYHLQ